MLLRSILRFGRPIPTAMTNTPSDILRSQIKEREQFRRRRRDPGRDEFFVQVPESSSWLDTATMPMVLTAVAIALFAKVLMMYDDSKAQERLERKIAKAPPEQGTVRMLSREEFDAIQEIRPRTPFESRLARPNARIRTGEPIHLEDLKDWATDVFTDALTRAEETAKKRNNKTKSARDQSSSGWPGEEQIGHSPRFISRGGTTLFSDCWIQRW